MFVLCKINFGHEKIDEKYSYFINYFQYCNTKAFKKIYGFPQNHLTLLEKILFSLKSQESIFESSRKVCSGIIENSLFDVKKDYIARKGKNSQLIKSIKGKLSSQESYHTVEINKDVIELIDNLNGTDGLEDYKYFENLLTHLYHLLFCQCSLEKHKDEIKYITEGLIAEYFRRGLHKDEITGLNGVLRKILLFRELKDNKILNKSEFPLPTELIKEKKNPNFNKLISDYLKSDHHYKLQLYGLLNYLKYDYKFTFIFKIENVEIDHNVQLDLMFNKVNYFRFNKEKATFYELPDKWYEDYSNFFSNTNSIFASTTTTSKSVKNAKILSLQNVEHSLNLLRYFMTSKGGTISNSVLFINESIKTIQFERPNSLELSPGIISELCDVSKEMNKEKIEFKIIESKMDSLYKIYINGLSQNNDDDIINYFWKYFESAYSAIKFKKAESIIKSVSKIIAKQENIDNKKELVFNLYNLAMKNCDSEIHGIPSSYYNINRARNFYDDSDSIISELKEMPLNIFMKDLIDEYEEVNDIKSLEIFYSHILWQLYEQRNFIQHNGLSNPKSIDELKFYYNIIINGWRTYIYNTVKNNTSLSYNEVLDMSCK